jgi:hypothetical protein
MGKVRRKSRKSLRAEPVKARACPSILKKGVQRVVVIMRNQKNQEKGSHRDY